MPLTNVTVTDDNGTPGDTTDDFPVNVPDLPVGACEDVDSGLITIPNPPTGSLTRLNIGVARGTGAGTVVTAMDDAELCTPPAGICPTGPLGGIGIGGLTNDLFYFGDGREDANWQSSSPWLCRRCDGERTRRQAAYVR